MPSPTYFAQFGLVSITDALGADECSAIRIAAEGAVAGQGKVWNPEQGARLSTTKQRTEFACLPDDLISDVTARLLLHRDHLAREFAVSLTGLQPLMFTRYDVGDFYGIHNDHSDHPAAPEDIRQRKLSVVVFLNQQLDEPGEDGYCGGRLTFHGLVDEPPWNITGHPLDADEGLMIVFRPDLPHQVTPVTAGSRYTLITWFY